MPCFLIPIFRLLFNNMRYILFVLMFCSIRAAGQPDKQKIEYTLDLVSADSFYLVERAFGVGQQRPDTASKHTLFRDTVAFKMYVERLEREAARKEREYMTAKSEFDSLDARAKRLGKIAKDGLGISGFKPGKKSATNPEVSAQTEVPAGFWVVYPVRGRENFEYIDNIDLIDRSAVILNQNGTTMKIKKPKRKK